MNNEQEKKEDRKALNHCLLTCKASRERRMPWENLVITAISPQPLKSKPPALSFAPGLKAHCGVVFKCINTIGGEGGAESVRKKFLETVIVVYLGKE